MRWDFGSVPDWIAAVGTVGALLAALILLGKELRAHRAREDREAREQASTISAWIDTAGEQPSAGYRVVVQNASTLPIHSCGVSGPFDQQGASPACVFGLVPPETRISGTLHVDERPALAVISDNPIPITLTFVDSYGQQWRRGSDGVLEPFLPKLSWRDRRRLAKVKLE